MNQTRRRCPLIDKRSRISPPALRVPAWRRDRALIEEVRLAPDSLVEEGGFETSVPRHGEVRAALHYSISGGVCGTGQVPRLTALSPARRDDMIGRIHSAVTVTPPPTNLWALLAFRESCAAKSSCATYGQPGNCRTQDLPSAV